MRIDGDAVLRLSAGVITGQERCGRGTRGSVCETCEKMEVCDMSVLVLRPDGAPSRDADRAVQADSAFLDRVSNGEF